MLALDAVLQGVEAAGLDDAVGALGDELLADDEVADESALWARHDRRAI